jgi:hypothetical protein
MTHKQTFLDQLVTETNPAAVFHLVVILLYLKKNGVVVHAAGRSVPMVFNRLKVVKFLRIFAYFDRILWHLKLQRSLVQCKLWLSSF